MKKYYDKYLLLINKEKKIPNDFDYDLIKEQKNIRRSIDLLMFFIDI